MLGRCALDRRLLFLDFLPRNSAATAQKPLLHWLIRRVEVRIYFTSCIVIVSPNPYRLRWYAANSRYALNVRPHFIMHYTSTEPRSFPTTQSLKMERTLRINRKRRFLSRMNLLWISVSFLNLWSIVSLRLLSICKFSI